MSSLFLSPGCCTRRRQAQQFRKTGLEVPGNLTDNIAENPAQIGLQCPDLAAHAPELSGMGVTPGHKAGASGCGAGQCRAVWPDEPGPATLSDTDGCRWGKLWPWATVIRSKLLSLTAPASTATPTVADKTACLRDQHACASASSCWSQSAGGAEKNQNRRNTASRGSQPTAPQPHQVVHVFQIVQPADALVSQDGGL